jgi:hypothetical protein
MDQAQVSQHFESSVKKYTNRFSLILIAGLATLVAILALIPRWPIYSDGSKFEAIIFVFILVTTPLLEILGEKSGQQGSGRFRGAIIGYFLAILAITLFALH